MEPTRNGGQRESKKGHTPCCYVPICKPYPNNIVGRIRDLQWQPYGTLRGRDTRAACVQCVLLRGHPNVVDPHCRGRCLLYEHTCIARDIQRWLTHTADNHACFMSILVVFHVHHCWQLLNKAKRMSRNRGVADNLHDTIYQNAAKPCNTVKAYPTRQHK